MKKQYIFIILILIVLYISYLILSFSYEQYKINQHIDFIKIQIEDIKSKITEWEDIIKYKSSAAYKNKILKEQQSFKNVWENVVFLTTEKMYNQFNTSQKTNTWETLEINELWEKIEEKTIFEKWMNLIYKKDTNN